MEIRQSARKHGIDDVDILFAWDNAIRYGLQDYGGETRLILCGPDREGNLLELVAVPASAPARIIHARELTDKVRDFLW